MSGSRFGKTKSVANQSTSRTATARTITSPAFSMTSVSNVRWTNYRTSSNPFSRGEDVTRTPAAQHTRSDRVTPHSGTPQVGTHRHHTSHTRAPHRGNTTTSSRTAHRAPTPAQRFPFLTTPRTALSAQSLSPAWSQRRSRSETHRKMPDDSQDTQRSPPNARR